MPTNENNPTSSQPAPVAPWFADMDPAEVARIKEMSRQEEARMGRILRRAARDGRF